jgi:hypothetical protein
VTRLGCPHCGTIYDVSRFATGHRFECVCGRELEVGVAARTGAGPQHAHILFFGIPFTLPAFLAQAGEPGDAEACAVCGTCGLGMGVVLAIPLAILALNVALLIWVARDAKARGMDNAVLWMILVMVTSVIGLVIYIYSRPKGELVPCASCGNQRLQASAQCPHCGNP